VRSAISGALVLQSALQTANAAANPQNGTYTNLSAAAKAAQTHYSGVIPFLTSGQEIGCGLYCTASGCGYERAVAGSDSDVGVPLYENDTALWHAHPIGDAEDSLSGHDDNVYRLMLGGVKPPFTVYTTTTEDKGTKTLWQQRYNVMPLPGSLPVEPGIVL